MNEFLRCVDVKGWLCVAVGVYGMWKCSLLVPLLTLVHALCRRFEKRIYIPLPNEEVSFAWMYTYTHAYMSRFACVRTYIPLLHVTLTRCLPVIHETFTDKSWGLSPRSLSITVKRISPVRGKLVACSIYLISFPYCDWLPRGVCGSGWRKLSMLPGNY